MVPIPFEKLFVFAIGRQVMIEEKEDVTKKVTGQDLVERCIEKLNSDGNRGNSARWLQNFIQHIDDDKRY